MLGSAVLGALPKKKPGLMRVHPHAVRVIRYKVRLAGQARHPEAVIRVRGKQSKEGGRWMCRVAYGNMQLIRRHYLQRRISIFPPELVPDDGDFDGTVGLGRVL